MRWNEYCVKNPVQVLVNKLVEKCGLEKAKSYRFDAYLDEKVLDSYTWVGWLEDDLNPLSFFANVEGAEFIEINKIREDGNRYLQELTSM